MKRVIAFSLLLTGCVGLGSRESSVMAPDGQIYRIRCQSDGVVEWASNDVKIKVDNRGPLGTVWAVGTASIGKIYDQVKGPKGDGE